MKYLNAERGLSELSIKYTKNQPLSAYTSFKIGGAARLAVFPTDEVEAVSALKLLRDAGIRILILGNGTNVLVSDKGFDGAAVILSALRAFKVEGNKIRADAGAPLTGLSLAAQKNSLSGLEFAYGIPGTVGGGIYMNAGAYGGDMASVVANSRYFDMATGEVLSLEGGDHEFSYRHSIYEDSEKVILSCELALVPGDSAKIKETMDGYMSCRREKQPLEYPSAGSVFKRGNGFITSRIIDDAGLKGRRVGGAEVSVKHAGFIVNRGGATAEDVLALIEIIKTEVKEKFGFDLHCEVRYIF